jgi:hypothetical protein
MIAFLSSMAILFSIVAAVLMSAMGLYSTYRHRWTDWIVVGPFYGGIGGLLYVAYQLCVRWLP